MSLNLCFVKCFKTRSLRGVNSFGKSSWKMYYQVYSWRGGRVVEGARLESVYAGNRIEGSNPSPSATATFKFEVQHGLNFC